LDGKVAVVTGGASGIGEASVRLFAEEGARVVIADMQEERGRSVADAIGKEVLFQPCEVSQEDQVAAVVARAVDAFGRLDCMFNNAGFGGISGPIEEIPVDEFDATFAVLLRGVFLGIKHAAPVMKAQGSGSIISTASVAGLQAGLGPHVYSAAKAAVVHLTRSAGMELGESGVRVNCICPGGIVTPLITDAIGGGPEAVELVSRHLSELQPIRRAGQPTDIAQAALWLASDESTFVNAQAIIVDGGLTGGRQWSQNQQAAQAVLQETGSDET